MKTREGDTPYCPFADNIEVEIKSIRRKIKRKNIKRCRVNARTVEPITLHYTS